MPNHFSSLPVLACRYAGKGRKADKELDGDSGKGGKPDQELNDDSEEERGVEERRLGRRVWRSGGSGGARTSPE